MMKVAIIGAGPTGLTIAHQLTKSNMEVVVYDSAETVGGFAKSIDLWGRTAEIGPHFLNIGHLPAVRDLVLECLNGNFNTYKRKTFILKKGELFLYPPSPRDMIRKLSPLQVSAAAISLVRQKLLFEKGNGTAKSFVKRALGNYLYKHFFEVFSNKLWGLGTDQISDTFAKSLIGLGQGSSLIKKAVSQLFKKRATEEVYLYPNGGLSTLWNAMKTNVEAQGGKFMLSSQIDRLSHDETQPGLLTHIRLTDGTLAAYDYIISTIPADHLASYLKSEQIHDNTAHPTVKCRGDVLVYLKVTFDSARDGQCFYVYDKDINIARITNFNTFSNADDSFAVILLEFWCNKEDAIWHTERAGWLDISRTQLEKTGIFTGLKILDMTVKKIARAFQVPDLDYLTNRDLLFNQFLPFKNLMVTGRYASVNFNYGMENAIDDGLKLARELSLNQQTRPKPETV